MKKALISPSEVIENGYRIAEIAGAEFPVAPPLYWVEVADDITAFDFYFVPGSGPVAKPIPPQAETVVPLAPTPVSTTPLQFIDRFTEEEQLAIVTATMTVPQVKLWYDKLLAAQEVVFADPRLSAGLDGLVAAGLIAEARKAEILPEAQTSGVNVL